METIVQWKIPMKTVSEANNFEHWRDKYNRHKDQKKWIWIFFNRETRPITLPCTVVMIRHAKNMLDKEDNLPMAFKWIKDYIADKLIPGLPPGRADNDPRITWEYDQVVSMDYFVEIKFIQK